MAKYGKVESFEKCTWKQMMFSVLHGLFMADYFQTRAKPKHFLHIMCALFNHWYNHREIILVS